ncbi:MAG: GNAT family N-acetyltransferase, partial [Alphaproteobacteria bacterium]
GVSRAITDFQSCCYLADLAVDRAAQRQGIGRRLVAETHRLAGGDKVSLILLSAPMAMEYYPRIGLAPLDSAFGRLRRS